MEGGGCLAPVKGALQSQPSTRFFHVQDAPLGNSKAQKFSRFSPPRSHCMKLVTATSHRAANIHARIRTSPFINIIVFILIFILLLFGQSLIHNFCLRTAYIFCSVELVHSTGQQHAITVQDHPFCQARLKEEPTCITSALGSYFGYSQDLPTRGPKDATSSLHFTEKTQQQHKT